MTNSADPDQLASNHSGSALFTKAGHILDQQGQGKSLSSLTKHSLVEKSKD